MVAARHYLWATGQVVRIRFEDGSWPLQEFVKENLEHVFQHANLKFMWHMIYDGDTRKYPADVTITFGDDEAKWKYLIVSAVGTECYMYNEGRASMRLNAVRTAFKEIEAIEEELAARLTNGNVRVNPKWVGYDEKTLEETLIPYYRNSVATQVRHEGLHLLGFRHEQKHPLAGIPYKADTNLTLSPDEVITTAYDPLSLAHYPTAQYKAFTIPEATLRDVPANDKLSELDIKGIQTLYPFDRPVPSTPDGWATLVSLPKERVLEQSFTAIT